MLLVPKIQINDENSLQNFNHDLDVYSKESFSKADQNHMPLSVSKTEIGPILVQSNHTS